MVFHQYFHKIYFCFQSLAGVRLIIPPDALNKDQTVIIRVCGGDGPLLPPHQVLLSPVVIVGPSDLSMKRPFTLHVPHCIHQPTATHNFQPERRAVERIQASEYYGWEVEVKPQGPQLKVCNFLIKNCISRFDLERLFKFIKLHKMKRNHQNFFSLLSTKAGAWAMVGAPKISSIQNFPSSSKSIFVLVYGRAVDLTALEVQIRIRVCDQLPSTFEMIEREELSQRSKRLSDPVTIGVTRSTAGKSLIFTVFKK